MKEYSRMEFITLWRNDFVLRKRPHPKFNVPNFGARHRKRVKDRWRKQRGIDNKKRTKRGFMGAEPNIGYGNPEGIRGVRTSGRRLVVVHSLKELKGMGEAHAYDVAIAHDVSKRKRREIISAAQSSNIHIINSGMK